MKVLNYLFALLFLFTFTGSLAQESYRLTIRGWVDGSRYDSADDLPSNAENIYIHTEITYANGGREQLMDFGYSIYNNDDYPSTPPEERKGNRFYGGGVIFEPDNRVEVLRFYLAGQQGNCTPGRGGSCGPFPGPPISIGDCMDYRVDLTEDGGVYYDYAGRIANGYADVRVEPVMDIQRVGSDIAGYQDPVEIRATEGFPETFYDDLQYQIGIDGDWISVPVAYNNSANPHILRFTPKDFLPVSAVNGNVNFRIKHCEGVYTNALNYVVRYSAPHINNITKKNVSCFDSEDGEVTITFDRPLENNEYLNVAIVDLEEPLGSGAYKVVKNANNITTLGASNSFTVEGLPGGKGQYAIQLIAGLNGVIYYSDGTSHSGTFEIEKPERVNFSVTEVVNVSCNGSDANSENNDGKIRLSASGGGPGTYQYSINEEGNSDENWQNFSDGSTHLITDLKPAEYDIRVRKALGGDTYCIAKHPGTIEGTLGDVIVVSRMVNKPLMPLRIEYVSVIEPTAFGNHNGSIKTRVYGGTMFDDDSYKFEWRNSDGDILTDVETQYVFGQGYFITLRNLPAGTYDLKVWDKNYEDAADRQGCFIIDSGKELTQPELLLFVFEEKKSISCFNDDNGELIVHAQGGVPLAVTDNGGLPYYYTWSKKDDAGQWELLGSERDSTLTGATAGEYQVIITDANEITTERFYTLQQPDLLEVSYTKTDLDCDYENKGSISISVTGGVPGYNIQWSNGKITPQIQDLQAGTYIVYVTDSNGCQAIEEITIEQPEGIAIQVLEQRTPTCFEGNDGAIHVEVTGGTAPYTYLWNTGDTNPFITDLPQGTYELKITDAKGCVAGMEYTLENPAPLTVNLGEDRTICLDQGIIYDITINDPGAIYKWESDNGFSSTSPIVELTEGGNYKATVVTSQGCEGTDELTVNVSDKEIDAYFLLTTQAFAQEEVVLVNVSEFLGESVEWTVPAGVKKVYSDKEGLIVLFEKPGSYDISLRSYQGSCYEDFTKKIIVEEAADLYYGGADTSFINEFIVYPNPTEGEFKVKISLAENAKISLKIISLSTSQVINSRIEESTSEYLLDYHLDLVPGVYLLLLETPKGDEVRKIIFN